MGRTWAQLRAMSDDELIAEYDARAKHADPGIAFLRDELSSRETVRLTKEVVRLTHHIVVLTWAVVVVALATLMATIFA